MIILDANIIISAIVGKHTRSVLRDAMRRGIRFAAPQRQINEAMRFLTEKLRAPVAAATTALNDVAHGVEVIPEPAFAGFENAARERLHVRGQSDWPVLAAALAYGAGIWSNDRDFFGVGAPVWSTNNIRFAEE